MAIQLPRYNRQVGTSAESGSVAGQVGGASAGYQAMGQFGEAVGKAGDVAAKILDGKQETRFRLDAARMKTETALLGQDAKNRAKVLVKSYNEALKSRDDYSVFGTDADDGFTALQDSIGEILSDKRLDNYPDLKQELASDLSTDMQLAQVEASYLGLRKLNERTKATFDVSYNEAIEAGDPELAIELIENSPAHTDDEKYEMQSNAFRLAESEAIDKEYMMNPADVISKIDEQVSGKESHYEYMDNDALRSKKAYAENLLAKRQLSAQETLYTPNSEYFNMNPAQKQSYIDGLHGSGALSDKAWKQEHERIMRPSVVDATPEHNRQFVGFQIALNAAAGNPNEQARILDEVTASGMPLPYRESLFTYQRDLLSPTGKTKTASYKYAQETMAAVFGRSDVVAEAPGFIGGFWAPAGFTDETREDLYFRAHAEAEQELLQWMLSTPSWDNADINAKVYEIVEQKSKEYSIEQIPARLGEQ